MTLALRSKAILYLLVFAIAGSFATKLEVSSDAGMSLLPKTGEKASNYQKYLSNFQSDKSIRLIWEGVACEEKGWSLLVELESLISGSEYVVSVTGLSLPDTIYPKIAADGIELNSFGETSFESASERCEAARDYDLFRKLYISDDLRAVSTNILIASEVDSNDVIADLEELIDPFSQIADQLGGRLFLAGESVMSAELLQVTNEGTKLVFLMPILAALLVYVVSRSLSAAMYSVISCLYSIVVVLGFMAAAEISSTPITSLVTFLLIPISSAFVIHAYGFQGRVKSSDNERSIDAFYIAGITTAIGFGSTAISSVPDLRAMGVAGLVGVLAATNFVASFVLPQLGKVNAAPLVALLPRWAVTSSVFQIVITLALIAFSVVGLSRTTVSYSPSDYLPFSNPVRADFEKLKPWFGRMTIPLVIHLPNGIADIDVWAETNKLVEFLERNEEDVVRVNWHYHSISTMTRALTHSDSGEQLDFPDSNMMLRQVYETLDFGSRDRFVTADESEMVLLIDVSFLGSDRFVAFEQSVLAEASRLNLSAEFIGRVPYFFEIGHSIAYQVGFGLLVTLGLISCVFLLYLRSLKLTLISSATNLIPVVVGVSVLGVLNVPLDLGSAIVAAIAFGLVIDDSTHYLVHYKTLRDMGYDAGSAVLKCSRELSGVIALTTISIVACFSSLLFVELKLFHDFAYLIAVTMIAALITDLYVLPRALILVDREEAGF